jgi:hypothetical protein
MSQNMAMLLPKYGTPGQTNHRLLVLFMRTCLDPMSPQVLLHNIHTKDNTPFLEQMLLT